MQIKNSILDINTGVTSYVYEEISDEAAALALANAQAFTANVERNGLLAETDWWALSDRTMTDAQTAYRQALRDVTGQAGFPADITWPTKPE